MATNRTDSLIASSGGDFTTIAAWEAAIGGAGIDGYTSSDLTATGDDVIHYGWLAAEEFDENLTIGGHTTDADCYISLAADSNGGTTTASQHSHTKTDAALMDDSSRALAYNSSYASILANNTYITSLSVTDNYTRISRIQFGMSGAVNGLSMSGTHGHVSRCLFESNSIATNFNIFTPATTGSKLESSIIIINGSDDDLNSLRSASTLQCTVVRSSGASLSATAEQVGIFYQSPTIKNCAFFSGGNGSSFLFSNGSASMPNADYNITDHSDLCDGRTGEGANNTYGNGSTYLQSTQFTAVDNTDWRVKSGHELDTSATDLTATVPVDIWGNAFSSSSPICGCENYVAAGGGSQGIPFKDLLKRPQMRHMITR